MTPARLRTSRLAGVVGMVGMVGGVGLAGCGLDAPTTLPPEAQERLADHGPGVQRLADDLRGLPGVRDVAVAYDPPGADLVESTRLTVRTAAAEAGAGCAPVRTFLTGYAATGAAPSTGDLVLVRLTGADRPAPWRFRVQPVTTVPGAPAATPGQLRRILRQCATAWAVLGTRGGAVSATARPETEHPGLVVRVAGAADPSPAQVRRVVADARARSGEPDLPVTVLPAGAAGAAAGAD